MNLQIECPECRKRFTIHEDLVGKTVECGSCETRFSVKKEMVIHEKAKIYPGAHKGDDFFNRLGRSPSGSAAKAAGGVAPAAQTPQVDAIMPASAGRNIAAATGFLMLLLYGLVFLLGTSPNGSFQDVDMIKRIILGSFVSIISVAMIIYGAKNWRFQATMMALVLVVSLAAATWIRPVSVTPTVNDESPTISPGDSRPSEKVVLSDSELKTKVGYEAVDRRLRLLEDRFGEAAPNHLVAIYVEDLKPGQYFKLEQYFMRAFDVPAEEGINRYERGLDKRSSLMVISGFQIDFDEAVRLCDPRLGRATTYPELRLIELKLSALHDVEVEKDTPATVGGPHDLAFFSTNYKALSSLNPDEVKSAVKALANVPGGVKLEYQEGVVGAFLRLLGTETDEELLKDLGKGLRRWGEENKAALAAVADKVGGWIKEEVAVPSDYLEFLIENQEPRALDFVDTLWSTEPEFWSRQYAMVGPPAEPRLIQHLESSPPRLQKAAAAILGTIGGENAATVLKKYKDISDEEFRIIVNRAIKAIEAR